MNQDALNTVIDKVAYEQVEKLEGDLHKLHKAYLDLVKDINANKINIGSATPNDLENKLKRTAAAQEQLTKSEKEALAVQKRLEASRKALAIAQSGANKEIQANRFASQEANRADKERARISSTLAGEYRRQSAILNKLRGEYRDVALTMGENSKEARKLQREVTQLDEKLKKVDAAVGQHQRSVGNYGKAWAGVKDIMMSAIAAFGIYEAINIGKEIYGQIKEVNALNNALLQVTETQTGFNQALDFVFHVSDRAGVGINTIQKAYTKFYASAKETKLTLEETQEIFETIATVGGVMALSTEDIDGALRAMEQMLSKGKIQAEEIRGQMGERLPGAFQILAKSMGLTTQELDKQLELGKVIADEVLPGMAREYAKAYNLDTVNRVNTLTASEERLSNEWNQYVRSLEDGDSFISKVLIGTFDSLSAKMKQVTEDTTELGAEWDNMGTFFQRTKEDVIDVTGESELLISSLGKLGEVLKFFKELFTISIFEAWAEGLKVVRVSTRATMEAFKTTTESGKQFVSYLKDGKMQEAYDELMGANKRVSANFRNEWSVAYSATKSNLDKIQKQVDIFVAKNGSLAPFPEGQKPWDFTQLPIPEQESPKVKNSKRKKQVPVELEDTNKTLQFSTNYFEQLISTLKESQAQTARGSEEWKMYQKEIERLGEVIENIGGVKIKIDDSQLQELQDHLNGKIPGAMTNLSNILGQDMASLMQEFKSQYEWDYNAFLEFSQKKIEQSEIENEAKKQALADYMQMASDAIYEVGNLFSAISDRRIQKIDDEIEASDRMYDEILSNEKISEEQRSLIEDEKEKKRQELEEKKRQERIKAARAEKAFAMADIAINTAAAIIKTYAQLGFPLGVPAAIAMGAIGALQIATVAATPIPKYKHGRKKGKAEFAEVGDGGRKEVITDSEGNIKAITPAKSTLTYLEKDDQVFPSIESFQKSYNYDDLMRASILTSIDQKGTNSENMESIFDKHLRDMDRKISHGIKEGFRNIRINNHNHTHINNNKLAKELELRRKINI